MKNRPAVGATLAAVGMFLGINSVDTASTIMFAAYFNMAQLSGVVQLLGFLPMLLFIPFITKIVNKHGKKEASAAGTLVSLAGSAVLLVFPLMPNTTAALAVYLLGLVIFGLGLLWKRASGVAAVVAAIGTFAFSVLFKFMMPEVPFLLRMGYVFIALVILFITLSLLSKKTVKADVLDEHTVKTQLFWSRFTFVAALVCLVLGVIGISNTTLKNNGFEAFFFLTAMFLTISIYLKSNATDKVQDPKAVKIDLAVFRSDAAFNWGAIGVIVILTILYYFLW
mgnify:CR=1 FL=1